MATFKVENFIAEVQSRGLSKPNRFEVVLTPPPCVGNNTVLQINSGGSAGSIKTPNADGNIARLVSLFAENTQLPQTRINTSRQQLFGPPSFHAQNAEYGGESMGITFLLDREMTVKRFFDVWVDGIVDRVSGVVAYQDEYMCQSLIINQLDEQDNVMYTARFTDVFPVAVNPVQLDTGMNNQVSKLNVSFNYRRWFWYEAATPQPASQGFPVTPPPARTRSGNFFGGANSAGNVTLLGSLNGIQQEDPGAGSFG